MEIYYNYNDLNDKNNFLKNLKNLIPKNKPILIVCIGTDKCIPDSIGPLTGYFIQNINPSISVIGTIKDPCHALNIDEKLKYIKNNYPNHFIIAVDACINKQNNLYKIILRKKPVQPGKGVGKKLPSIGDISILGITGDYNTSFFGDSCRLYTIFEISQFIASSISEAIS